MKMFALPVLGVALIATGCGDDLQLTGSRELVSSRAIVPTHYFVDSEGRPLGATTADSMNLEKIAGVGRVAVTTPDGRPVTWGQFRQASGTARLICGSERTRVRLSLRGLVPNGGYSASLAFFRAPGFEEAGMGALAGTVQIGRFRAQGKPMAGDGEGAGVVPMATSIFTERGTSDRDPPARTEGPVEADGEGRALIDAVVPSESGRCLLDEKEVHVLVSYHLDGRLDRPPSAERVAEHLAWPIRDGRAYTPGAAVLTLPDREEACDANPALCGRTGRDGTFVE